MDNCLAGHCNGECQYPSVCPRMLRPEIDRLRAELAAKDARISKLEEVCKGKTKCLISAYEQRDSAHTEIETLRKRVAEWEAQHGNLSKYVDEILRDLNGARARAAQAEAELAACQEERRRAAIAFASALDELSKHG